MLYCAAIFVVVALVTAFFGLDGVAAAAQSLVKIAFFVFVVLACVGLISSVFRRK